MRSIFERRVAFKPFEYPEVLEYKEAIQHSYWLVSEWNFAADQQDFAVRLTPTERSSVKNALLAISQVEVAVKRFWARLGDRIPKAEFDQVGVTFGESECYDRETEVLTSWGWVAFPDIPEDVEVAQYNIDTGRITFARPTARVVRPYRGVMHHYLSTGTDLMVTPGHEILVKHPAKDVYEKRRSEDGRWGRNYRYPIAGYAACNQPLAFGDIDRLLIAIQADGSLYGCTPSGSGRRDVAFNLQKERKIRRLCGLLDALGIEFTRAVRSNGQTAINFALPDDLDVDVAAIKGFDYIDLARVDASYGRSFVAELALWDSGSKTSGGITYYNANERAVDKAQAIAALAGFSTNKGVNRTAEQSLAHPLPGGIAKQTAQTVYALHVVDCDMKVYPYAREVAYDGIVYCLTMPEGNLVTRRGKRVAISGNCRHADAYSHLLQVLGLNGDFEQLLTVPAIRARVDYLSDALSGAAGTDNEKFALTLALFSIFVENVSLFSQFLIIKAFDKHRNVLKDIDNVIQATMREETVHALFGAHLIRLICEENPSWFGDKFRDRLVASCRKAFEAERQIVDWIFEAGELDFLPKSAVVEFIKKRFNESLGLVGVDPIFDVDAAAVASTRWFDDEVHADVSTDFFHKKPVTYSKKVQAIQAEDLF